MAGTVDLFLVVNYSKVQMHHIVKGSLSFMNGNYVLSLALKMVEEGVKRTFSHV